MSPKIISAPNLIENLPSEVKKLFAIFGDDIRLVGGCVRDLLLEKTVSDFDFATRFLPAQTIQILQKNKIHALETGVKFGTITAVVNSKNFEITTLRHDKNQRGRHTDVEFIDDYFGDAQRRDFTINALYLDSKGKIYDYFDGISDLKKQQVKFIGDASLRISEDFLRILRFFRFSLEYSKTLDIEGLEACIAQKKNLKKLSRERIRQEFSKILKTSKTTKLLQILEVMKKEKILAEIFSPQLQIKALTKLLEINSSAEFELKIAVLFLSKKTDLAKFSHEICATNKEKKFFRLLLSTSEKLDLKGLNRLLAFYDQEFVIKFYLFKLQTKHLKYLQEFELPKFPVTAKDLIKSGLSGKQLGEVLTELKLIWADADFVSDKDLILELKKSKVLGK
jgi:poly(A) polymerase